MALTGARAEDVRIQWDVTAFGAHGLHRLAGVFMVRRRFGCAGGSYRALASGRVSGHFLSPERAPQFQPQRGDRTYRPTDGDAWTAAGANR